MEKGLFVLHLFSLVFCHPSLDVKATLFFIYVALNESVDLLEMIAMGDE